MGPKLQYYVDNAKPWAKQHKIKIIFDKTTCIGKRHKTRETSELIVSIGNNKIKQINKQTF